MNEGLVRFTEAVVCLRCTAGPFVSSCVSVFHKSFPPWALDLPRSGLPPRSLSPGLYLLSKSVSVFSSFSYFSVFGFVRAVDSRLTPISEAVTSDRLHSAAFDRTLNWRGFTVSELTPRTLDQTVSSQRLCFVFIFLIFV